MNEKCCPVCGKWFIDKSRSHNRITCCGKCRWEYSKRTDDGKFNHLLALRIQHFKGIGINFTSDELNSIKEKLKNCTCDICGQITEFSKLHIDHDHNNGKFRGILCDTCNFMLGASHENTTTLENAISYLNSFS